MRKRIQVPVGVHFFLQKLYSAPKAHAIELKLLIEKSQLHGASYQNLLLIFPGRADSSLYCNSAGSSVAQDKVLPCWHLCLL